MLFNYYFYRLYDYYTKKGEPLPFVFSTLYTAIIISATLMPLVSVLNYLLIGKQFGWYLSYLGVSLLFVFPYYIKSKHGIIKKYTNLGMNKISVHVVAGLYLLLGISGIIISLILENNIEWYFDEGILGQYLSSLFSK